MLLETRQNEANTTSVGQKYSGFNRLLLKKIGAKTKTFFSHCSGRNSLMYSIIAAKIRLSEQKTKFYLSFLEREYLRAKLKGSAN